MAIEIVGIGEALFDVYPDREVLGGAPLNFAVHASRLAARLGLQAAPASRIGWDARGERIKTRLAALGVSDECLQPDIDHPTGTVEVTIDAKGQPSYVISSQCAWDFLQFTEEFEDLAAGCKAVCFGTLAQRRDGAREAIEAFVAKAENAIRLFDVNLRQDFYDLSMLRRGCALATDLKVNESELEVVSDLLDLGDDPVAALFERFPLERILLTRGEHGCVLYRPGKLEGKKVSYPAKPNADAVGAGDAASAGYVVGLLAGMADAQVLDLANNMGAWVASQPGATPELPAKILDLVLQRTRA